MVTRLYIFLYLLLVVDAAKKEERFCEKINESRECFKREIILSMTHNPNQMAIDNDNYLYFSFDSGQGEYVPAKKLIGQDNVIVLKGVKDAFAMAFDTVEKLIYFGGSHGIYKYNPSSKKLKRLAVDNLDIWWLVIKKDIFFIKFPNLSVYWYANRTIKYMHELRNHSVHQFVFDKGNNIFFINSTGLYGVENGQNTATLFRNFPRFLAIASDKNGYVYVCSEEGIFTISKVAKKLKKVVNVQGVLGLTFDNDNNMIYSDSHEIIRLIQLKQEEYYKRVTTKKEDEDE